MRSLVMSYSQLMARLAKGEIALLDGATGTELQRRGAAMDPAAWCGPATLGQDDLLTEIHLDYIRAGSQVITANTFASSRLMLGPAGFGEQVLEINQRAVAAALRARDLAGDEAGVVVAGSLSHMVPVAAGTDKVDPNAVPSDAQCSDAYHELAHILKDAGVDHLMLEMMYHPGRVKLVLEAALSTGLPIWFGASARRGDDGALLAFDYLEDRPFSAITSLIPADRVDVAGIMHTGSELVGSALAQIRTVFDGPLSAYPDSGFFESPDWNFHDTIEPDRLQQFFGEWIGQGAQLLGGCCGLTVAHIEAANRARQAATQG